MMQIIRVDPKTAPSPRQRASATCLSAPGSRGGAAGSSGQGPSEPKQEAAHPAMVAPDDDEFTNDPHQTISTEEVFTTPVFAQENPKGSEEGYPSPAEATAFRGIYYHKSGDVWPSHTGASTLD